MQIGDHVKFLRSSAKNIVLTGTIEEVNADGLTVNVKIDGTENFIETAHVNDCTLIEAHPPAEPAAAASESLITVNGQPL